ncbi:RdgB/HAM1 family non-canonical purine NTP pyrophosphatase [bacterium]|nr:RdgB/HAM1 family non-canonical purine NTP pyrophosphatase [bacterium]
MKIVFATRNKNKVREISSILDGISVDFISLDDYPKMPDTVEDGQTFEENAIKKAREAVEYTGFPALADDSGLCVDALSGGPGIYSARFAGPGCTYDDNNNKLLHDLKDVKAGERGAYFLCVSALVLTNGRALTRCGQINGIITREKRGSSGFGYDPIFALPDGRTFAEISAKEKDSISHRAKAFKKISEIIRNLIDGKEL